MATMPGVSHHEKWHAASHSSLSRQKHRPRSLWRNSHGAVATHIGNRSGERLGKFSAARQPLTESPWRQPSHRPALQSCAQRVSAKSQRRAWIALVLAQEPEVLLLDEPTTFLDISHQLELLQLLKQLHKKRSTTTVMALHDLSHAGYNATRVIALREGTIVASGPPSTVLTSEQLSELYGVPVTVLAGPTSASGGVTVPIIVPSAETPE